MAKVCLVYSSLDLQFLFMEDELVSFVSENALDEMVLTIRLLSWTRWVPLFLCFLVRNIFSRVIRSILSLMSAKGISFSQCHSL